MLEIAHCYSFNELADALVPTYHGSKLKISRIAPVCYANRPDGSSSELVFQPTLFAQTAGQVVSLLFSITNHKVL